MEDTSDKNNYRSIALVTAAPKLFKIRIIGIVGDLPLTSNT